MQKNTALIGGIAIIAILAIFTWQKNNTQPEMMTPTPQPEVSEEMPVIQPVTQGGVTITPSAGSSDITIEVSQPTPSTPTGISATEVAKHSTATDCYSIVGNKVYTLTNWITKHPGGERAILGLCGKDGTESFTKKHGSSAKAQATLTSFYLAELAK